VSQENLNPEQAAVLSLAKSLIGEPIFLLAESCLTTSTNTEVTTSHFSFTAGVSGRVILRTVKSLTNGRVKCCLEMSFPMENVSGTMATSEQ
jgi:hypothetical protein